MFQSKYLATFLSIAVMLFIFNGCSDDSPTGVDDGDPPQIPEVVPVEIDRSIFQDNNPTGQEYEAFNEAGALAEGANANLVGTTVMGHSFLIFTQNQNATFEDGKWVWTFSYNAGGESMTIKTTAEEVPAGTEWNLYLSGNFEGETIDEFKYLTGIISSDGNSGTWEYFIPGETGQPYVVYEWQTISDTQFNFSSIISFPDEDGEFRIDYERDGDNNYLEYSGFDFEQDVFVFWNSSTGAGYIDRSGQDRQCWDDTFAVTTCS
ncbi:hypothetical protein BH23BAC3_BH23BAC3_07220 [soil metagenome]